MVSDSRESTPKSPNKLESVRSDTAMPLSSEIISNAAETLLGWA